MICLECCLHRFMLEERVGNYLKCSLHRLGFEVMCACYYPEGRGECLAGATLIHFMAIISLVKGSLNDNYYTRSLWFAPKTVISKVQNSRKCDRSILRNSSEVTLLLV